MKFFDLGALRQTAMGGGPSAASELVERTLAQHGLLTDGGGHSSANGPLSANLPTMKGLMAALGGGAAGAATPKMPQGAQQTLRSFTGPSGGRSYRVYVPDSAKSGVRGVVMMLHGCTQTPEDFAAGTKMDSLAEQHGFVVIYPQQSRGDNAQSCWNWFSRGDQRRGRGEPAILAGIASEVCAEHQVARDQTFVAGLSAGGAMAAILGETYPDVFAAVGVHSGLPVGAAKDVASAFSAMGGTVLDPPALPQGGPVVRTIVFHGTADATVSPKNGDLIVRRALDSATRQSIETARNGSANGRSYKRTLYDDATGDLVVEHWQIDGQGHAWSGGAAAGSYTDPQGPDASAEMLRFFFAQTDESR